MPLSPKARHAANALEDIDQDDVDAISKMIHGEVRHATQDLVARAHHAEARLQKYTARANKRILKTGRKASREARHPPLPVTPVAIGVGIMLAAYLLGDR
jgi:hypothetical protein